MSEPSTHSVAQSMVRRNLDDCRKELLRFYDHGSAAAREDDMHHAVESLLRAVSELTRLVEGEAALTFEPFDVLMGDEAAAEIARQGIDPQYEAFRADRP